MNQAKSYSILLKKIAKNIQKARKQKGLTQENMIDYGFNYRHYQKVESGSYSMNLYTLYRLSNIFNVSIRNLLK